MDADDESGISGATVYLGRIRFPGDLTEAWHTHCRPLLKLILDPQLLREIVEMRQAKCAPVLSVPLLLSP